MMLRNDIYLLIYLSTLSHWFEYTEVMIDLVYGYAFLLGQKKQETLLFFFFYTITYEIFCPSQLRRKPLKQPKRGIGLHMQTAWLIFYGESFI